MAAPRPLRPAIAALGTGVIALALLLLGARLPVDADAGPPPPPSAAQRFEEAAEKARTEGASAFAVALDEGVNPPGDTVFMRHRDLVADARGVGARLSLSALASSEATRNAILDALAAEADDPRLAYRIGLERARLALRFGRPAEAAARAQTLLDETRLDPLLSVDALFVAAHAALETGEAERADALLARAIEIDPAFFNARQSQVIVLATHLPRLARTDVACLDGARRLLENAAALPSLAGAERRLFLDLADALSRASGPDHAARAFAAGVALGMAGDVAGARARLARAADPRGVLPQRCEGEIARAARLQLQAMEPRS